MVRQRRGTDRSRQEALGRDEEAADAGHVYALSRLFTQYIARRSLVRLNNQYPVNTIEIEVDDKDESMVPVGSPATLRVQEVQQFLARISSDHRVPISHQVGSKIPVMRDLERVLIQDGFRMKDIYHVSHLLSEGTTQGTVYHVDILRYENIDYENGDARSRQIKSVPAVLKRTPVVPVSSWKRLHAMHKIQAITRESGSRGSAARAIEKLQDTYDLVLMDDYSDAIVELSDELMVTYSNFNEEYVVDTVASAFASLLVEKLMTPAFPLFYGCTLVNDQHDFTSEDRRLLGRDVGTGFPVSTLFIQKLERNMNEIHDSGYFTIGGISSDVPDPTKIWAYFAQMVFALSVAQEILGLVHNDLHRSNIFTESTDQDYLYYYREESTLDLQGLGRTEPLAFSSEDPSIDARINQIRRSGKRPRYYRVPTFGIIFKPIDFGRCKLNLTNTHGQRTVIGAQTVEKVWKADPKTNPINPLLLSIDLTAIIRSITDVIPTHWIVRNAHTTLVQFINDVLTCQGVQEGSKSLLQLTYGNCYRAPDATTTYAHVPKPVNSTIYSHHANTRPVDARKRKSYESYFLDYLPYREDSQCTNSILCQNTEWFDYLYGIPASEVPNDAIITSFILNNKIIIITMKSNILFLGFLSCLGLYDIMSRIKR